MKTPLENFCWPAQRLGEALDALARRSGLGSELSGGPTSTMPTAESNRAEWLAAYAATHGLEVEPFSCGWAELESSLPRAAPAILRVRQSPPRVPCGTEAATYDAFGSNPARQAGPAQPDTYTAETRYLLLTGYSRGRLVVLTPQLETVRLSAELLRTAVCGEMQENADATTERVLDAAQVPLRRRRRAHTVLMGELLRGQPIEAGWLLRTSPSASWRTQAREFGLGRDLLKFLFGHAAAYALWIISWWLLGAAVLRGRVDAGWFIAWVLVLAAFLPLRILASWSGGAFGVRAGALLKRRLMHGALQLDPDRVRTLGTGQLLGRVLETEVLDTLALTGGFLTVAALIELAFAALVLPAGAGGAAHSLLLLLWLLATCWFARRQLAHRRRWTDQRFRLTDDLVEKMIGHRTRLAQEPPEHWHTGEDQALARYHELSGTMDRSLEWLRVLAPRGWLVIGMLALAPAFVWGASATASLAVSIGGVLLAYHAFRTLGDGIDRVISAVIAWDHVRPFWEAPETAKETAKGSGVSFVAGAREDMAAIPQGDEKDSRPLPLLEARQVEYCYPARTQPALRSADLDVGAREWILLEGPSGGGKSTLAAVLAGLRDPQSGLVLFRGLDRASLGDVAWRRRVLLAPQFHQNHLMLGTLAFNLLLGRGWPPQPADLQEAEAVCRELGLGPVLDEMPSGMFQIVGETGWQLSQGQRSRVFIARALLQRPDVLILDESVDALDPETLSAVLTCLRERAPTLLLIAHP